MPQSFGRTRGRDRARGHGGVLSAATLPANTVAPAITPTTGVIGDTLTCSTGTWTGSPAPSYTYQWKRAGANIAAATASTYVVVAADVRTASTAGAPAITCVVTATNTAGAPTATSNTVTLTQSLITTSATADFDADFGTTDAGGGALSDWATHTIGSAAVTQATGSARPTLTVLGDATGTHSVITFDGTTDYFMSGPAISGLISASAYTIYAVFRAVAIDTANASSWTNDAIAADASDFWGVHLHTTNGVEGYQWDGAAKVATRAVTTAAWHVAEVYYDGVNVTVSVDRAAGTPVPAGNVSDLSGALQIGRPASASFFDGKIARLIFHNAALSAANRLKQHTYLYQQYGIAGA